ncbi:hypothetical protein Leryth_018242 [Lithospermum erythrorhizon]|nr:hypothetical protein Leryth_018242 [Lithospermum erythrorhizon]
MLLPLIKSEKALAPALYVFGDSLFDSGNNNMLPTLARANFKPYGVNFANGATGRFTNGRTLVDFIAEYIGLPYSPPYMSVQGLRNLVGLNYASSSCGILPETGDYFGKCFHLEEQISLFQKRVESELPRHLLSSKEIVNYLSQSIYMMSIGSNDYIINYFEPQIYESSKRFPPEAFAKLLIDNLSQQLQRLYKLGARKIVVFEIGPLGCIPSIIRKSAHIGLCVEQINNITSLFNVQLSLMLNNIRSILEGSDFILGHSFWISYDAIIHPANYGLEDSSNPCCITWKNGTSGCIPYLSACSNPSKRYFWDGYHVTEPIYKMIAEHCFNDSKVCMPKTIQELLEK